MARPKILPKWRLNRDLTSRKPGARLRFEDMVDESIVRELEKSGFIDKVYKQ